MRARAVNTRWMFAVVKLSLLYAAFLQDHFCEASCPNTGAWVKNILFISPQKITLNTTFPTDAVYMNKSGKQLCFNLHENKTGCCEGFDCSPKISLAGNCYKLTLNETALCNQDVVVLQNPAYNFSCMPSTFYSQGLMLNIQNCLKMGGPTIRFGLDQLFGNSTFEQPLCEGTWPRFGINSSCRNNMQAASLTTPNNLVSPTSNVTLPPTNNSTSSGTAHTESATTTSNFSTSSVSVSQTSSMVRF
ncbi:uncharacterized protein LOC103136204 [Poecilia formosa]|uniref:uncharacterized protein LOC103136204 n=1 Tax=Poecilia formosa TaxID=48698 RepID=UPI0007B9938B|nr:PREDICTED: uncharacterized protein LOC103136204 [Poecilia formosa]